MTAAFVPDPVDSADVRRLYEDDLEQVGFVMAASRVWAHQPELHDGLFTLLASAARACGLTFRQRGVLITACASTLGDSYCSLAWGTKLAGVAGAELAASVLEGTDVGLDDAERVLAAWARVVVADPNGTTTGQVQALREVGYSDAQVVALTVFVALRAAFSSVNDALGASPDAEWGGRAPAEVLDAVTYGRDLQTTGPI